MTLRRIATTFWHWFRFIEQQITLSLLQYKVRQSLDVQDLEYADSTQSRDYKCADSFPSL